MSSDKEFECSQVSVKDYMASQSYDYGLDIVDNDEGVVGGIVSLENDGDNVCVGEPVLKCGQSILYDNIVIENISSDEEVDKM